MPVVVVSRNPALAIGLSGLDVVEVPPRLLRARLEEGWPAGVTAVVLDAGDVGQAVETMALLRGRGVTAPTLLVAGDDEEWHGAQITSLPGTRLLPLPVTRGSLRSALRALVSGGQAGAPAPAGPRHAPTAQPPGPAPPLTPPPPVPAPAPPRAPTTREIVDRLRDEPLGEAAEPPRPPGRQAGSGRPRPGTPSDRDTTTGHPAAARQAAAPMPPPAAAASTAATRLAAPVTRGRAAPRHRRRTPAPSAPPASAAATATAATRDREPRDGQARQAETLALVRKLIDRADELLGVSDVAELMVAGAVESIPGVAGALLVEDEDGDPATPLPGSVWRVAAGSGLRPLEYRVQVPPDHWLVTEIAQPRKAVVIDGTDIIRAKLRGAPLASRQHLLAAAAPSRNAVLVLSRNEGAPPFGDREVDRAARICVTYGQHLDAAILARRLARRLDGLRDLPN